MPKSHDYSKTSFQEAMTASLVWCNAWEKGELSDEVLADKVSKLLTSKDGARGFFVISLSGDCPLLDRLPDPLIVQLQSAGEVVVDLTVRNMAMSKAMAIHHQRKADFKQKDRSERVTSRCIDILRLLESKAVKKRIEQLLDALKGKGEDVNFLERWNYDEEQKKAIKNCILSIAEN